MLEDKLVLIKQKLVEFATLVEYMIDTSIKGLLEGREDLLHEVLEKNEPMSNNYELELDELCTVLIAQYEPKAKDLRTTLMVLKMNNDLERIGDLAVNICESGLFLIKHPQIKPLIDTPRMGEVTAKMLKDSIDSFVNEDVSLAYNVCERDNIVDGLRNQILRELVTYMSADPSTIERALQLIRIAQNLERAADLSTNIAEDVIYMVQGKIIKHHKQDPEKK